MSLRAIFGGTFDPIHWGHIKPLQAVADELALTSIHLMPSAIPPHREQPGATPEQRLQMVQLACLTDPRLVAEDWELRQSRPSYSAVTLRELRQRWPNDSLVFILGMDAFCQLDQWYEWQGLFDSAHLVVLARGQQVNPSLNDFSAELAAAVQQRRCQSVAELTQQPAGRIYFAKTPLVDISATQVRQLRRQGKSWQELVPNQVADYIRQQQLYP